MITRRKFEAEIKLIDGNTLLAPEEFRPFWEYYKKGFLAWYHGQAWEERHLHKVRLGWASNMDPVLRLKGTGYYSGWNACALMEKKIHKTGREPIGKVLQPLACPEELKEDLKTVADHYRVSINEVRRAAYIWYTQNVLGKLGLDSYIKRRENKYRSYFFELMAKKEI